MGTRKAQRLPGAAEGGGAQAEPRGWLGRCRRSGGHCMMVDTCRHTSVQTQNAHHEE